MDSIGEVDLPIKIGKFCCSQRFVVVSHKRRKPPGHPEMSGRPRGATRSYPDFIRSPGKLRVIVNLYRGGSNYGPQAVGTALDIIARAARRANPRIYEAYVVSSLIESCILGVDFLVPHRVALDFSSKRITGPELGVVNANNNLELSTILCHNHGKSNPYPEMYANVISDGGDAPDEDWECHDAVPDYIRPPTIDLPECDAEFLDIVEIYKDLFSSIPDVAKVKEFRIRTANSNPVKVPPRLVPQAYHQEVQSQVKEMCEEM